MIFGLGTRKICSWRAGRLFSNKHISCFQAVWEFRRYKEDVEQADLMHRNSGSSIIRMERLAGGKPPTYGWFKLWMELVAENLG